MLGRKKTEKCYRESQGQGGVEGAVREEDGENMTSEQKPEEGKAGSCADVYRKNMVGLEQQCKGLRGEHVW